MKKYIGVLLALLFLFSTAARAQQAATTQTDSLKAQLKQLEKRINNLEKQKQHNELQKLLQEAQSVAQEGKSEQKLKTFKSGQRSLQAINPEISVTGDAFGAAVLNNNRFTPNTRSGAHFRVVGLHFQSALDPFSFTKMAIEITPQGIELGEAYITWSNFLPNISATAGKFRQQFGIVNRWHKHSLDQFDFPLALTTLFGEDGLNQTGVSFDWLMPAITAKVNDLTLQITNGQNGRLFNNKAFSFPVGLVHFKNYYDLNPNTYLELGLTGMAGYNNFRGFRNQTLVKEADRLTKSAGVDLTLFWEPLNRAHYHSFLWRSELYYVNKTLPGDSTLKALGGYSYIQYKMNERWFAGFRYDYTQPFIYENAGKEIYQLVPYLTWWQSHWMRFRLEFEYKNGNAIHQADKIMRLQLTWAAGPHKHDRY